MHPFPMDFGYVSGGSGREGLSRNFLQRLNRKHFFHPETEFAANQDSGETELNLGLSLGSCFSAKPRENELVRSSSIASLFPVAEQVEEQVFGVSVVPLARNRSLPAAAGEEARKRKEMQNLKRMEAKRKRSEKRDLGGRFPQSQGLIGSPASSSSGFSDSGGHTPSMGFDIPRLSSSPEDRSWSVSPGNVRHMTLKGRRLIENHHRRNILEEMPSVATKGDGVNCRRIEGFLYNYKKGEVKIVCACHGSFLSPAEFVRHAGGGDVDHPLKHIVVNHSPSILF